MNLLFCFVRSLTLLDDRSFSLALSLSRVELFFQLMSKDYDICFGEISLLCRMCCQVLNAKQKFAEIVIIGPPFVSFCFAFFLCRSFSLMMMKCFPNFSLLAFYSHLLHAASSLGVPPSSRMNA